MTLPEEEEIRRVLPAVEQLARAVKIPISIDTRKSAVAARALDAGATIVNDISGLTFDPQLAESAARSGATLILMHSKGSPQTMQDDPQYDDLILEICGFLESGIARARAAGIEQIIVDPGIGFGKTISHNLQIIRNLREFRRFGLPVLVGPSRKSFIGKLLDLPVDRRLDGTAAAVAASIMNGAAIVRVHDVAEMKRVSRIVDAIVRE